MASIILKRGDERVQPHPLSDLLSQRASARPAEVESSEPAEVGEPPAAAPEVHEKTVEVLRQGGAAIGVEVRCACGEVTVIEFDYTAQPVADDEPDEGASA